MEIDNGMLLACFRFDGRRVDQRSAEALEAGMFSVFPVDAECLSAA